MQSLSKTDRLLWYAKAFPSGGRGTAIAVDEVFNYMFAILVIKGSVHKFRAELMTVSLF